MTDGVVGGVTGAGHPDVAVIVVELFQRLFRQGKSSTSSKPRGRLAQEADADFELLSVLERVRVRTTTLPLLPFVAFSAGQFFDSSHGFGLAGCHGREDRGHPLETKI